MFLQVDTIKNSIKLNYLSENKAMYEGKIQLTRIWVYEADHAHKMYEGIPRLEPKVGILTAGLNPILIKEVEGLEQANKERKSWEKVTQENLFNHSGIGS